MTNSQLQAQLAKVKAYLDAQNIASAISKTDVVFEIGGEQYRATSIFAAKRLIRAASRRVANRA